MKKIAVCLLTLALFTDTQARTILTPRASDDYKARLEAQKSIASRMSADKARTDSESEALKFLYAYMPTPDVLDYDGDFYLLCVTPASSQPSIPSQKCTGSHSQPRLHYP